MLMTGTMKTSVDTDLIRILLDNINVIKKYNYEINTRQN